MTQQMTALEREKLGEWLSAYVDGELNAEQNAIIERLLDEDDEVRARLEELRTASRMVAELPRHAAPPSILDDIRRQTERDALIGGAESDRVSVPGQVRFGMRWLATAAMLAVVVSGAYVAYRVWPARQQPMGPPLARNVPKDGDVAIGADENAESGVGASVRESMRSAAASRDEADLATFDQKIARHSSAEEILEHPFANEMNVVTLAYATDKDRDASLAELTRQLRATRVRAIDAEPAVEEIADAPVFLEGRAGVNYEASNERQLLLRVPKRGIETVVNQLDASGRAEPSMQVGPISVRGRSGMVQLAQTISRGDFSPPSDDPDGSPIGAEAEALNALLENLNLKDQGGLLAKAEEDPADAERVEDAVPGKKKNGVILPGGSLEGPTNEGEADERSNATSDIRSRSARSRGSRSAWPTAPDPQPDAESADATTGSDERTPATGESTQEDAPPTPPEGDGARDDAGTERAVVPTLPDRPPLAARRLQALRERADQEDSSAGAEPSAAAELDAFDEPAEEFVTLVIRLVSNQPAPPKPAGTPKPTAAKAKPKGKPGEPKPNATQ